MDTQQEKAGWKGRALRLALCAAVLLTALTGGTQAALNCAKIDAQATNVVGTAVASQPAIANSAEATAAYWAMVAQESSFANQPSGGTSKDCPGVPVSYGYGQVNYAAHRDTIHSMMGVPKSGSYCNDLKAAGQWMLDNPQQTTNLSAKIFADNLNACGGDVGCALNRYCGGCDKHTASYIDLVNAKMTMLGSCADGLQVVLVTPKDGGKPFILGCRDIDLIDALRKAQQYYSGLSMRAYYDSFEQGRQNYVSGSVVSVGGKTYDSRKELMGDVRSRYCLAAVGDYLGILQKIMNPINLLMSVLMNAFKGLLNAVCNYVVTMINNALASVCIPLPDLGLDLPGLGGASAKSCNGISLLDIMSYRSLPALPGGRFPGTLPPPDSLLPYTPIVRGIAGGGLSSP